MEVIITKYGTKLTDTELDFRKLLIAHNAKCPVTGEFHNLYKGEVLYIEKSNEDIFISEIGLERLTELFGEKFIKARIITYD